MSTNKIDLNTIQGMDKPSYTPAFLEKEGEESNYFIEEQEKKEQEIKDQSYQMRAEDIEYERALQDSNYVYRLSLKAKDGNCNAIKKLLSYSCVVFNAMSSVASKLLGETQELLSEQKAKYSNGHGMLSDSAKKAAEEQILKNDYGDKTDVEKAQEYNDLISEMEIGCSSVKL